MVKEVGFLVVSLQTIQKGVPNSETQLGLKGNVSLYINPPSHGRKTKGQQVLSAARQLPAYAQRTSRASRAERGHVGAARMRVFEQSFVAFGLG